MCKVCRACALPRHLMVSCGLWLTDHMVWGWQLASAAVMAGADGAAELAALEAGGGMRDTAVATAVYDCHYRPYTQRQARTDRTRARTYKSAKRLSRGVCRTWHPSRPACEAIRTPSRAAQPHLVRQRHYPLPAQQDAPHLAGVEHASSPCTGSGGGRAGGRGSAGAAPRPGLWRGAAVGRGCREAGCRAPGQPGRRTAHPRCARPHTPVEGCACFYRNTL